VAVEALAHGDIERAAEWLGTYPQIGFVDATVAAIAERLRLEEVVTTDRRHFSILRPRHCEGFRLLP
jgi:predicted nucleic acid-binding protein